MRALVVCCDGTWNTLEQETGGVPTPTNVVRLHHALAEDENQLRYYHPGVGTGHGLLDKLTGGGMGVGLSRNVKSAYAWLAHTYQPGDAVHLFGFSRGAYTVRSLTGMIGACGLAPLNDMDDEQTRWAEVDRLYDEIYRPAHARGTTQPPYPPVPITFVGVWDTVGSLGIPDQFAIQDLFHDRERHEFHDTRLSSLVQHARHAVALDEARAPFTPTLWTDTEQASGDPDRTVRQVWFVGVHCDVGGGYPNDGLSDTTLRWMIDEATGCTELRFRKELVDQIHPDPADVLHNNMNGFFEKVIGPRPRAIPRLDPEHRSDDVHSSVYERQICPPITAGAYRTTTTLAVGASTTVDVFAGQPWNNPGLYLEPGSYEFTATGEWLDGQSASGPAGGGDGRLELGDVGRLLGDVAGGWQDWLRRRGKDHDEQVLLARRQTDEPWMALMGVVADRDLDDRGAQAYYVPFLIGSSGTHTVPTGHAGYFYAFANDAWACYGNNRGSVRLTVTRLS